LLACTTDDHTRIHSGRTKEFTEEVHAQPGDGLPLFTELPRSYGIGNRASGIQILGNSVVMLA
jgi:hypothetical protein